MREVEAYGMTGIRRVNTEDAEMGVGVSKGGAYVALLDCVGERCSSVWWCSVWADHSGK
jgi:hypothetical protein